MKQINNKRLLLATLSLFCGATVLGGIGFINKTMKQDVRAKAEDTVLYNADFESLSTSATADDIYGATSVAGTTRSVVESIPSYIEAPYSFWETNGCQNGYIYLDTGKGISSTDTSKNYDFTMVFNAYGLVKDTTLSLTGADNSVYNSVIIFHTDGTSLCDNYGSQKYITLSSATMTKDGWWTVKFTAVGTGGYIFPLFYMNTTDAITANQEKNTGIRLSEFSVSEGDNFVYNLSFATGLIGNDAIYQATGFAGIADAHTVEGIGIEKKSLKCIYDFWSTQEGGWQKEPLYINENNVNVTMEKDKEYILEFEVAPFGKWSQTICLFDQIGVSNISSQVILKSDGSFEKVEYGETKIFENCEITNSHGIFKVKALIKGYGGKFKLMINMLSSDADGANIAKDTGTYLDNLKISAKGKDESTIPPVEELPDLTGDYATSFANDFNNVAADISGSDAMFNATGFAGQCKELTTESNSIGVGRSLKAVYSFYPDGGWQNGNAYLDSGRTSGTSSERIYRFDMKLKPFGSWKVMYINFQSPTNAIDAVILNKDGTISTEKASIGSFLIKQEGTYENGIFNLSIYMYGTDGYIFNFFNMQADNIEEANSSVPTGFYLDDYKMSKQKLAETIGLNKRAYLYNKNMEGDFITPANFSNIAKVRLGEITLNSEQYTFENGILKIKQSVFTSLSVGTYTLHVATAEENEATAEIVVKDLAMGVDYTNDFTAMPDLTGGQAANDTFYQNSYMDPASQDIYTVDENGNRIIKFISQKSISESYENMFQFNPREGRLNMLKKDALHTVSIDFKPENCSLLAVKGLVYENDLNTDLFIMEFDVVNGKRVDDGKQSSDASWSIVKKENGWYTLTISFSYAGENFGDNAAAYLVYYSVKEADNSVWFMDNIDVQSELFPSYKDGNVEYDLASGNTPYYLLDLCRTFNISSLKIGDKTLVENTDYIVSTTPVGYTRIDLKKEFCVNYTKGSEQKISVTTSKGNIIDLYMTITDTTPILPLDSIAYDKAEKNELSFAVDLVGQSVALIAIDDNHLIGTEYTLNEQGNLIFKYSYLKNLMIGDNIFTLTTSSGAKGTFTIVVSDSTPIFGTASVYEKKNGGDWTIDLLVNNKDIVSVILGDKTLAATDYTYADGKLTIKAAVMESLVAKDYTLTVTTNANAEVTFTVKDAAPVITGEYTVTKGRDLVITIDIFSKAILSVTVDKLALKATEYSYVDGKLTIQASVFDEIAEGQRNLVVTTAGGSVEISFTLNAKSAEKTNGGCKGSISIMLPLTMAVGVMAVALKKRK